MKSTYTIKLIVSDAQITLEASATLPTAQPNTSRSLDVRPSGLQTGVSQPRLQASMHGFIVTAD